MMDYYHLEALAAVVREGSFERAARTLNITQSAVSQRLKLLEDQVGQLLVVRSTPPQATRLGRLLVEHLTHVRSLERELDEVFQDESHAPVTLPIGVNADSLAGWFLTAVAPLLKQHQVLLELIAEDERHTRELLRRGEVIGCVTAQADPPQGCDAEYLGSMRYRCLATRAFQKRYFADGMSKAAISTAPAVVFNRKDNLHAEFLNEEFNWKNASFPAHYVPSSEKFFEMVQRGHAYGLVPDWQSKKDLAARRLIELAPRRPMDLKLYWHYSRYQTAAGKQLTAVLKAESGKLLK